MRELLAAFRNWITGHGSREPLHIAARSLAKRATLQADIEAYFTEYRADEVLATFHRCRAILVDRKLLKKERSDKGTKRTGKQLPLDASANQATSVNGGETA